MTRIIVGTLVGALLVFIVKSALWMAGFHESALKYHEGLDTIYQAATANLVEEGVYWLPGFDAASMTQEEQQAMMAEYDGKPWAILQYHPVWNQNMARNMGTGLLWDVLSVLLICLVIRAGGTMFHSFGRRFGIVMAFALFALFNQLLSNWTWWYTPMHFLSAGILDLIVGYVLAGVWLGWYLKPNTA